MLLIEANKVKDNEGQYFYFYAEDAVRRAQCIKKELAYKRRNPHVVQFEFDINILAEYLGLGIYPSVYDKNHVLIKPYRLALEFSIPYDIICKYHFDEKTYQYSCIGDEIYQIPYGRDFENIGIPEQFARSSYKEFDKLTSFIMELLNVGILSPEENYEKRGSYGFSKFSSNYPQEEAIRLLKKLER